MSLESRIQPLFIYVLSKRNVLIIKTNLNLRISVKLDKKWKKELQKIFSVTFLTVQFEEPLITWPNMTDGATNKSRNSTIISDITSFYFILFLRYH